MKPSHFIYFSITVILLFSFSCGDEPILPNPEEEITSLTYTLTPDGGGENAVFTFRDIDGEGGNPPVIVTDTLLAGTIYYGQIELLNESTIPVTDVSLEVQEEAEDHQFFYDLTGFHAIIMYTDLDSLGYPIGLTTSFVTGGVGEGTMKIILRHLPDKTASGVSIGNILNAGGETDIEVIFDPVVIQ